jgi:transcription antitermination factor NusG
MRQVRAARNRGARNGRENHDIFDGMPLLPKDVDFQPEELFSLPFDAYPWAVAHVRSRQEKVLARHLAERGVPFYLPLAESRRIRGGRNLRSFLPIFPGYLFFRAAPAERGAIWRSNVVANVIDVPDQAQFGAELEQIRLLQLSGASFEPHVDFVPGMPVRVEEGVFAGYSGVVVREKARDRLIVRISLLRTAVAVELDRSNLKPRSA